MLPAYVAYLLTGGSKTKPNAARALTAGLAASLGFFLVFLALGAAAVAVGSRLEPIVPAGELLAGLFLIVLGALFLAGRAPGFALPTRGPTAGARGATFRFGVLYAVVCLACSAPLFLSALLPALGAGFADAVLVVLAYALAGAALLTLLTLIIALSREALVARVRAFARWSTPAAGLVLLLVGFYLLYYYAKYTLFWF